MPISGVRSQLADVVDLNDLEAFENNPDLPARKVDLLHHFLRQNNGRLSHRAVEKEPEGFTDAEVSLIETVFNESITRT